MVDCFVFSNNANKSHLFLPINSCHFSSGLRSQVAQTVCGPGQWDHSRESPPLSTEYMAWSVYRVEGRMKVGGAGCALIVILL